MIDLFSIAVGWATKKMLDFLWESAGRARERVRTLRNKRLVDASYLEELEHKAKCLELLTRTFDDLSKIEGPKPGTSVENRKWYH